MKTRSSKAAEDLAAEAEDLQNLRDEIEELMGIEDLMNQSASKSGAPEWSPTPKHRMRSRGEKAERAEIFEVLTGAHTLNQIEFGRWDGTFGDDVRSWLGDYANDLVEGLDDPLERMLTMQFAFCHHRAAGLLQSSVHSQTLDAQTARNVEAGRLLNIARRQAETIQRLRESRTPKPPDLTQVVEVVVNILQVIGKENIANELGSIDVTKLSAQLSRTALSAPGNREAEALGEVDGTANETGEGAKPVERVEARPSKRGSRRGKTSRSKGSAKRKRGSR